MPKKSTFTFGRNCSLESKQNQQERLVFREKLETYLKAGVVAPEIFQVWFWDETGFSLRVIRRKCWTRRGSRQKVRGTRQRGRINVMGGLRYHDRLSLSFFIDKGNGESFFESLEKLNNFVGTEWVKQGNKLELYERIGSIVLVILDNASYHKRQDIPSENRASTTKYTTRVFTSLQSKFQFN